MKRFLVGLLVLVAMGAGTTVGEARLRALATTTIVGDVVQSIAGDRIDLTILLPPDADPHAFQPTPRDVVAVSNADVIFLAGAGLEAGFEEILENASGRAVDLSERLPLRRSDTEPADHPEGGVGEEGALDHDHGEADPHVWFDPTLIVTWCEAIEETLAELDPDGGPTYRSNGESYRTALEELDGWIRDQTDRVPADRRRLITDHLAFGYFAERYGFEQVGSVFPGFTTLAEPSAREIADLIETIERLDVPAIFVGMATDPTLAKVIADDTGIDVVRLYTGALSDVDGPAATYIEFMRYDVGQIVNALSP